MDLSPYIAILKDAFFSNLIFTLSEEVALSAIFVFGGYNYLLAGLAHVVGAVAGLYLTFLVARLLPVIFKKYAQNESYESFKEVINKFSIVFFALAATPFAGFIMIVPIFAGIANLSSKRFLILTTIYKLLYIIVLIIIKTK